MPSPYELNQHSFFGVGNSGNVAQEAQHKFFRLGLHTAALSDSHLQITSASLLGPGGHGGIAHWR